MKVIRKGDSLITRLTAPSSAKRCGGGYFRGCRTVSRTVPLPTLAVLPSGRTEQWTHTGRRVLSVVYIHKS